MLRHFCDISMAYCTYIVFSAQKEKHDAFRRTRAQDRRLGLPWRGEGFSRSRSGSMGGLMRRSCGGDPFPDSCPQRPPVSCVRSPGTPLPIHGIGSEVRVCSSTPSVLVYLKGVFFYISKSLDQRIILGYTVVVRDTNFIG